MCSKHCKLYCLFIILVIFIGILIGLSEASLWIFGFIPTVRFIIPYATADALLIFALTPILALWASKRSSDAKCDENDCRSSTICLNGYVKTIMITDTIFLIFVQIFVGTLLPRIAKIILSLVGSTSFWVMLIAFIVMVFYIIRRR